MFANNRRSPIYSRTALFLLIGWAFANLLSYSCLKWFELEAPSSRHPSQRALKIFESSAIRTADFRDDKESGLRFRLMSPAKLESTERYPSSYSCTVQDSEVVTTSSSCWVCLNKWPKPSGVSDLPVLCLPRSALPIPVGRLMTRISLV